MRGKQSLKEVEIARLARLIHSVVFAAEPAAIVEGEGLSRFLVETDIQHKSDNRGTRAALAVIAVHGHHRQLVTCIATCLLYRKAFI